jgi:hypothetical protein
MDVKNLCLSDRKLKSFLLKNYKFSFIYLLVRCVQDTISMYTVKYTHVVIINFRISTACSLILKFKVKYKKNNKYNFLELC